MGRSFCVNQRHRPCSSRLLAPTVVAGRVRRRRRGRRLELPTASLTFCVWANNVATPLQRPKALREDHIDR
jgi:hypothetical protein